MTSTLKAIFLLAILSLTASVAQAQNASLTHIFPQVVDGMGPDRTIYTSRFLITSNGATPATCQVSRLGLDPERLSAPATITVQGGSFQTITTRGEGVIDTGYARLDCSQPVVASLAYSRTTPTGIPLGFATVPNAPNASIVLIPMVLGGGYRHGIALANDKDAPQVVVLLFDSNSGATTLVKTIQVQPRSQYVAFVDELFNVPADGLGTLTIGAVDGTVPGNFHITALLFNQFGFTNVV